MQNVHVICLREIFTEKYKYLDSISIDCRRDSDAGLWKRNQLFRYRGGVRCWKVSHLIFYWLLLLLSTLPLCYSESINFTFSSVWFFLWYTCLLIQCLDSVDVVYAVNLNAVAKRDTLKILCDEFWTLLWIWLHMVMWHDYIFCKYRRKEESSQ